MSQPIPVTAESLKAETTEAPQWYGQDESLGPCWIATSGSICRGGYSRVDLRIRGLGGRQKRLSAHILAWILDQLGPMERDELYLAYLEVRASGLQCEHRCESPGCRRPSHLWLCTQQENIQAGKDRALARTEARGSPIENFEPEPWEVEF